MEILVEENPFLTVVIGDFNAKSKNWCSQDSDGTTIKNLTYQFGLG